MSILVLVCFVFIVMFFASFSGSVKRAGIMMLMYLSAELLNEQADSLNSLGFSAVCLLCLNPYAAVNASFLLSFVATLTIITVAVPISDAVNSRLEEKTHFRFPAFLKSAVICLFISLFVNLTTLALQIRYFGGVSLVGVLANLALTPVVAPLILGSGLYVMFYFLPGVSTLLFWLSNLSVQYLEKVVLFFASFKYSYIELDERFILPAALLSACVYSISLLLLNRRERRIEKFSR